MWEAQKDIMHRFGQEGAKDTLWLDRHVVHTKLTCQKEGCNQSYPSSSHHESVMRITLACQLLAFHSCRSLSSVAIISCTALWRGPFEILARPSNVNYELKIPEHYQFHPVFHVSMLRPCYDGDMVLGFFLSSLLDTSSKVSVCYCCSSASDRGRLPYLVGGAPQQRIS